VTQIGENMTRLIELYLKGVCETKLFRMQKQYVRFGDFQQALYEGDWDSQVCEGCVPHGN
jgi:hypothetical protein